MNIVLDACALIAYVRNEPGAQVVEDILLNNEQPFFIHAVNFCEVYYDFIRSADLPTAKHLITELQSTGLIVREDMDQDFWESVGKHKADIRRISLADCFCLTLAQRLNAELVTSDHREFDPIVSKAICPIRFIR